MREEAVSAAAATAEANVQRAALERMHQASQREVAALQVPSHPLGARPEQPIAPFVGSAAGWP